MEYCSQQARKPAVFEPRVIIHGGAGNITRENLSPEAWKSYEASLLRILRSTQSFLHPSSTAKSTPTAIDAAVHAVSLLESDPLFNCGIGAVFTRAGTIELEASVMVSQGMNKRGAGVSLIKHVRSPISLAAELLKRGQESSGGGAQGHVQISGATAEELAQSWELEMCDERTFWTRKRWEEHKRGLQQERVYHGNDEVVWPDGDAGWDGKEYLPQGTVGCVVLDSSGTLAVATSTGGLTNKLPGRLGDTPTLGAGFWAEHWLEHVEKSLRSGSCHNGIGTRLSSNLGTLMSFEFVRECLPNLKGKPNMMEGFDFESQHQHRSVAMSGTGNGDSFLKLSAVRTVAAFARFSNRQYVPLQTAVSWMAGPEGELQRSAEDRWGKAGEGEGGIIGIELAGSKSSIVFDFNRAMFRAWVDDKGKEHCMVFREPY